MRLLFTARAEKDFADATPPIRKALAKQLDFLLSDLLHPSLHAKKYDESSGIWQGRVHQSWRFYFVIDKDECVILTITPHPK